MPRTRLPRFGRAVPVFVAATLAFSLSGCTELTDALCRTHAICIQPDLSRDQELRGTVEVEEIVVPAGVTITATGALELVAAGNARIDGAILGDCVPITIRSGGDLVVTGIVRNACSQVSAGPPPLLLVGSALIRLIGANIESSGDVEIVDDPALVTLAAVRGRSLVSSQLDVRFEAGGTRIISGVQGGGRARAGAAGRRGRSGADGGTIRARSSGDIELSGGTVLRAQSGGHGGAGETHGGNGGDGGDVLVKAEGTITFRGAGNRLHSGDGGNGGSATNVAGQSRAEGGDGGAPGTITVQGGRGVVVEADITLRTGDGGNGGHARAGPVNGTARCENAMKAFDGKPSVALGGEGGGVTRTSDIREQASGPGEIVFEGATGGRGGDAQALGGRGADGRARCKRGGDGGLMRAIGGDGGNGRIKVRNAGGEADFAIGTGGRGGDALFDAGRGGTGFPMCDPAGKGGNGGDGGEIQGKAGDGGLGRDALARGAPGSIDILDGTGSGGDGGDGAPPGSGGKAGTDRTTAAEGISPSLKRTAPTALKKGADGGPCGGGGDDGEDRVSMDLGGIPPETGVIEPDTYLVDLLCVEEMNASLAPANVLCPSMSAVGRIEIAFLGARGNHFKDVSPVRFGVAEPGEFRFSLEPMSEFGTLLVQTVDVCPANVSGIDSGHVVIVTQLDGMSFPIHTEEIGEVPAPGECWTIIPVDGSAAILFSLPVGAVLDVTRLNFRVRR